MRIHQPNCRRTISGLILFLLVAVSFCYADQKKTVEVVGVGECADCLKNNIKNHHALQGLKVTIDCKLANGEVKTRGEGKLDQEGRFQLNLPQELLDQNKKLKEECYAQLHSASNTPCPSFNGIESSKIAFVSEAKGKHTFSPIGKLKFSPITCTSAFLWPFFKYPPLPSLPPLHDFPKKSFPKLNFPPFTFPPEKPCPPWFKKPFPPIPKFKKPIPPPTPVYVKPLPPPTPVYVKPNPPPTPVYKKPCPPPVPVYHKPLPPPVPIYHKPLPPPVPIYHKPLPPPVPIYKPPIPKKPCPPILKKPHIPLIKPKPLPPIPKLPPITKLPPWPKKKPCPLPKLPPFPKLPPHPKFPPKIFEHPKYKKWPSLPLVPPHP